MLVSAKHQHELARVYLYPLPLEPLSHLLPYPIPLYQFLSKELVVKCVNFFPVLSVFRIFTYSSTSINYSILDDAVIVFWLMHISQIIMMV